MMLNKILTLNVSTRKKFFKNIKINSKDLNVHNIYSKDVKMLESVIYNLTFHTYSN